MRKNARPILCCSTIDMYCRSSRNCLVSVVVFLHRWLTGKTSTNWSQGTRLHWTLTRTACCCQSESQLSGSLV